MVIVKSFNAKYYSITVLLYLTLIRLLCSIKGHILRGLWPNIIDIRTTVRMGESSGSGILCGMAKELSIFALEKR